jgi:hypothetical protein
MSQNVTVAIACSASVTEVAIRSVGKRHEPCLEDPSRRAEPAGEVES